MAGRPSGHTSLAAPNIAMHEGICKNAGMAKPSNAPKPAAKPEPKAAPVEGYDTADALGPGITLVERSGGRFYSPLSAGPAAS